MARVFKLVLVVALLLLDALVVTPWLLGPSVHDRAIFGLLAPLAIGLIGSMLGKKKKTSDAEAQSGKTSDALNQLLSFQKDRMMAAEPLQQASLSMASGMMPTYMKQPGGGIDQWTQKYNAGGLPGLTPRAPAGGGLPGAQYPNFGGVDPRAITSAMMQSQLQQPPYMS
jgi:hypothetical protein